MLELRELVKHYRAGEEAERIRAVDGVSLTVAAGELVGVYGPSGSGKSTMLELIATFERPDSGAVLLDGRDVSTYSTSETLRYRLQELGLVPQTPELQPGATVLEDAELKLWLSDSEDGEAHVRRLLERLGLSERLNHRTEKLSMGERQRVMIARALSMRPRVVLADEPTGSLDSQRGREVLELLREVCKEQGVAMVLATHDPRAAAYADRVFQLRDGRLGPYDPALASGATH
jgi:putative ABC transport system ATP-binding protein